MSSEALLDTGPLVALLNSRDRHHAWAREALKQVVSITTCEAVVTEACHLLRRVSGGQKAVGGLLLSGALRIAFDLDGHSEQVFALMNQYENVPMSLADACLVRMSELNGKATLLTLDSDFRIYRRHGDKPLDVQSPE